MEQGVQSRQPAGHTTALSGTTTRIAALKTEVFKPEGAVARLKIQLKYLEDRRGGNVVEHGGRQFKDQRAVEALIVAAGEESLAQFCVDFFSLIHLTKDPYETVAKGIASEATSFKAQFTSLLQATLSVSYALTYPNNMFRRSNKKEAANTKCWIWGGAWSTNVAFSG